MLVSVADPNPIVHETLQNFLNGRILLSWGSLLGLQGLASLAPLVAVEVGLSARILWLLSRPPPQPVHSAHRLPEPAVAGAGSGSR